MIPLDDEAALRAGDPSGLLDAFATLPRQLREGYAVGLEAAVPSPADPRAVVLCGVGGSAAAADVVEAALAERADRPVVVLRDDRVPTWVDDRTLVVCLSYSGTTAETIAAAEDASRRRATPIVVASGGPLAREAGERAVLVPPSAPAPRAALGWLTGALLGVLEAAGIGGPDGRAAVASEELERTVSALTPGVPMAENAAKRVADRLGDRVPVVWAPVPNLLPAALRWKAAFNENAEIPAFASFLPELAHHEVVGWTKQWSDRFAVVGLRAPDEEGPAGDRTRAALDLIAEAGIEHEEIHVGGRDLAALLGLIAVGDFASTYHALMRGIDPAPIEAIRRLKDRLR
ncbi:MAG TPA: SIS domain-containing protein [Actinomycetota bacterium]|nr:SIS domain-containing protein [Actinomycetota bacterium]